MEDAEAAIVWWSNRAHCGDMLAVVRWLVSLHPLKQIQLLCEFDQQFPEHSVWIRDRMLDHYRVRT